MVFLVRHAEKVDHSEDPELSEYGKERAVDLMNILRNSNIEYVHHSNFIIVLEKIKNSTNKITTVAAIAFASNTTWCEYKEQLFNMLIRN